MAHVDSRIAPKFVVRFDDDQPRVDVEKAAKEQHISMNAFILQAIDEKLARGARIDRLLDLADTGARLQQMLHVTAHAIEK